MLTLKVNLKSLLLAKAKSTLVDQTISHKLYQNEKQLI